MNVMIQSDNDNFSAETCGVIPNRTMSRAENFVVKCWNIASAIDLIRLSKNQIKVLGRFIDRLSHSWIMFKVELCSRGICRPLSIKKKIYGEITFEMAGGLDSSKRLIQCE